MANEQNLKPFKKGKDNRRNLNGRPKKFVNNALDEIKSKGFEPVSKSQVADIYQIMIALPEEELRFIGSKETGKNYPMILRIIASGILSNKGFEIIEKMLDRAQGKAVDINANLNMTMESDDFNIFVKTAREEIREAKKEVKDEASGNKKG